MKIVIATLLALQFGQRGTPAETLLEPELLRTLERATGEGRPPAAIAGAEAAAGEIVLTCAPARCDAAERAMHKLGAPGIPRPARSIRLVTADQPAPRTAKAAVFVAEPAGVVLQVIRGPWSTAGIGDEVVEILARHAAGAVVVRPFAHLGQPRWDATGVPTTALVPPADAAGVDRASFVAAAMAYFLATLPNAGAEALLSHLTVGAHARLAEDGRRAVTLMGNQQRAGGDVLVLMSQAIEREQRRMRSFARFMPEPVDAMLLSRIADMEKSITSVWTSMGITSSPFVPAAERLRGRSGEDRRVPTRTAASLPASIELAPALAKHPNAAEVTYELINFIDGTRSISDIRDAVAAELGGVPLPAVVDYFEKLVKTGAVTLR